MKKPIVVGEVHEVFSSFRLRFHQSSADRGEVNEAILSVLYKQIPRYASSLISGGKQPKTLVSLLSLLKLQHK